MSPVCSDCQIPDYKWGIPRIFPHPSLFQHLPLSPLDNLQENVDQCLWQTPAYLGNCPHMVLATTNHIVSDIHRCMGYIFRFTKLAPFADLYVECTLYTLVHVYIFLITGYVLVHNFVDICIIMSNLVIKVKPFYFYSQCLSADIYRHPQGLSCFWRRKQITPLEKWIYNGQSIHS